MPRSGASGARVEPPAAGPGSLGVLSALAGRRVLLTGATGFVGKVTLSLLLDRQPDVGQVYVLVRPSGAEDAEARWRRIAETSPAFEPLRRDRGGSWADFLRSKVAVLPGDAAMPGLGLSAEARRALGPSLDLVVNVAGLIAFNPSLAAAVDANVLGTRHAAELAAESGARLIHVSTAYVAGLRRGAVSEDEPLIGPSPASGESAGPFSAQRELDECLAAAARVEESAAAQAPRFKELALARLAQKGRPASERSLRLAAERACRQWVEEELARQGRERARAWGWPNTYCYSKALGERLIAATPGLRYSIVRPSIVESSVSFPFPGWNEGMNTSAPVILAMCKGLTPWPAHPRAAIDFVPVDQVAAAALAVAGASLLGVSKPVYHLASSDTNPFPVRRCMRLVGRYSRAHWREHANGPLWLHWLLTRAGVVTVSAERYRRLGAPALRRAARAAAAWLGRFRALRFAAQAMTRAERDLALIDGVAQAFLPFIHEIDCVFRTDNLRALYRRMSHEEREALPWAPEAIDWPSYWFDIHVQGLRRWIFPWPDGGRPGSPAVDPHLSSDRGAVNRWLRRRLAELQGLAYGRLFESKVRGAERIPSAPGFIVASNHASHLDMGLVKHALGAQGRNLVALAAKDYFFRWPLLRFYFANFTNLLPIGRASAVKDSLADASAALHRGRTILIFPEATRSLTGRIAPFRPTLGYLALKNRVDILPVHLEGTFESLPKGSLIPRRRRLAASIGPVLTYAELRERTRRLPAKEAYRAATALAEAAVRGLAGERTAPEPKARAFQAIPSLESA